PPEAWSQDPPLEPTSFELLQELSAQVIFSWQDLILAGNSVVTSAGLDTIWGGTGRLYGSDSKGPLGTAVRYGYIGGRGAQPPGTEPGTPTSKWRLGTVTWGSTVDSVAGVTEPPGTVWGQFAFGWRGNDGDPRDGVKQGRIAVAGLAGGVCSAKMSSGGLWAWKRPLARRAEAPRHQPRAAGPADPVPGWAAGSQTARSS
ncbi:MAG: hypothetical protein GY856_02100, partial [bacterium]|nr:hypothetical protein [bacterium]